MPAALTGYHALPTAAQRALNLMVSKYSRNQADNESRYPPPHHALLQQQPRPASPHTRDALLRDFLSHSFAPPHSFIPPWSSFCQSARRDANLSPKPGQSALTLYANASPLAQLTHSLCAPPTPTITYSSIPSFIYFTSYSATPPPLLTLFPFPALHIVVALQPSLPLLFAASHSHFFYQSPVRSLSRLLSIFQHLTLYTVELPPPSFSLPL